VTEGDSRIKNHENCLPHF